MALKFYEKYEMEKRNQIQMSSCITSKESIRKLTRDDEKMGKLAGEGGKKEGEKI